MISKVAVLFGVFVLLLPGYAKGDLIHGFVDIGSGGFDFSEQKTITDLISGEADVWLTVHDPPGGYFLYSCQNQSLITVSDSTLDELTVAPADSSEYSCDEPAQANVTYVIHTVDGLYAKFSFDDWPDGEPFPNSWVIEYYVQMDGTRNLDSTIPVEDTTWGGIKALYGN